MVSKGLTGVGLAHHSGQCDASNYDVQAHIGESRAAPDPSYPRRRGIQYAAAYRFNHCAPLEYWIARLSAQLRTRRATTAVRYSRGAFRPGFANRFAQIKRAQGMPGACCTRGLVCNRCAENAHTSIQVQSEHSGIPCAMVLRLTSSSCVRKICQNVRTGGSDQPPVAGSDPVRAQRPRACRGARDRSGVFLNPNSCTGFEPEPSKEGSG